MTKSNESLIELLDKHIAMPADDDHQRGWRRACEFIKDKICSGQLSSEIPVVDEPAEILKAIADYKAQWKKVGVVIDENDVNSFVGGWTARAEAFPPKPVSVSLEECAMAIQKAWWNRLKARGLANGDTPTPVKPEHIEDARAVLDAAGVVYGD